MKLRVLLLSFAALAAPGQAEWLRASSRHFVIYSDTRPAELRAMATRLERFDAALRKIHHFGDPPEMLSNPVTVFVADDVRAVERLCRCQGIAGFYQPRASGAVAFTPRVGAGDGPGALKPQIVLFHEYAHHILLGNFGAAFPAWYSEGYAEVTSTAQVTDDGVQIGGAANHRAYGLFASSQLSMAKLFAPPAKMTDLEREQINGRGWLLTHYAMFDAARSKRMNAYLDAFAAGKPPLDAARETFGDLKELDRDRYLRASTLPAIRVPAALLPAVTVDVRPLTAGERALIDLRMISTRGVDAKLAQSVWARASKLAVPAHDAVAQGWLAEMAYDAGQDVEAEAAADRALATDPRSIQALLYKARVHLRRASQDKAADPKVWSKARSWIIKANRVDPNNSAALALFYQSFGMAGERPSPGAIAGIHRALELVPQDPGLRFQVARQDIVDGKLADARRVLQPLAYSPHARPDNPAMKLIALIDQGQSAGAVLAAGDAQANRQGGSD